MSRSDARRHAFSVIFQFPFHQIMDAENLVWLKLSYLASLSGGPPEDDAPAGPRPSGRDAEYMERVIWGALDKLAQLDGVIENFLKDWELERINRVDLALLRLAIYEMLCEPDVPFGVAVNEAVELAKAYGSDDSPSFINGVLGNVAREIKGAGRG